MKFYVTRHGQVAESAEYFGDVSYPKGDMPLSRLGREQAEYLGRRLRDEGFSGKIFASPYLRTMETADIVADITGSKVYPTAALHEIFLSDVAVNNFFGSDIEKLSLAFKNVAEDAELEFPWWPTAVESAEDVRYRVALFMDKIIDKSDEDVLLVGHGASVSAAIHFFFGKYAVGKVYNCSYSSFDTKTKTAVLNCGMHLPYKKITYNSVFLERKPYDIEIPEKLANEKGLKLLHIGDTPSRSFPWYRALINKLKPDVIIHTGDTVDEIKVGRVAEVREEYIDRLKVMLEIMTETGSRVIWTTGNNDLEDKVREIAPGIELVANGTVINIGGKRIALAHHKKDFKEEADIYLYGHTTRYDVWSDERNTEEQDVWYLNACWTNSVIVLPERRLYKIPVSLGE